MNGPDRKGIVATVSQILDRFGCPIQKSEHWIDRVEDLFFQRVEFSADLPMHTAISAQQQEDITTALAAECGDLHCRINWRQEPRKRVAIFVSQYDHCLWELLLRHEAHELDCDIVAVVSNHETLRHVATTFHIPFHVYGITADTKLEQEEKQLQLLQELQVDLVVLARYMQVLSSQFLHRFPYDRILNIHHSFLPAFAGTCNILLACLFAR